MKKYINIADFRIKNKIIRIIFTNVYLIIGINLIVNPSSVSEFSIRMFGIIVCLEAILFFIKTFSIKKVSSKKKEDNMIKS